MTRVLLVEDEPAIADTLVYALQTDRFEVVHCLTGEAAIARLQAESFGFVILDIGLPDMTGFEVCKRIFEFCKIPLLFLTARDSEVDRITGLEIGGDDYVTKPFSPREVSARVRAILRRTQQSQSPDATTAGIMRDASLRHDEKSMHFYCYGACLDLTAHEYKLLLALFENQERVLTRDQLLEKAWYDPGSVTDRTVDAHIKSLRAKMRQAHEGSEEIIQTRRGIGYVLVIG
jgi:two-component system catabolic regulation response regulator CreB